MNYPISRNDYDNLPFRDDVKGEYVINCVYRARHYSDLVFVFIGTPRRPDWQVFKADVE